MKITVVTPVVLIFMLINTGVIYPETPSLLYNESSISNCNIKPFPFQIDKNSDGKNIKLPWIDKRPEISPPPKWSSRLIQGDMSSKKIMYNRDNSKNNRVIHVDDDNVNGPWLGTPEYPYRFINDAVMNSYSNDIILVHTGFYYESVFIDKTITMIGEDRDNVIIHGYNSNYGIAVFSATNVLVSGFTITGSQGVYIISSSNTVIQDCYIRDNIYAVTISDESYNCSIKNSLIDMNEGGVWFLGVANCSILNCTITNQLYYGVYLDTSPNSYLRGNNIANNMYNFGVDGWSDVCLHDIDTSNTINGEPIYYLIGQHGLVIDESYDIGFLALHSCSDIAVINQDIDGVLVSNSNDITIRDTSIKHTVYGVYIMESEGIELKRINDRDCCIGLLIVGGLSVSTSNCVWRGDYGTGVHVFYAYQCTISSCILQDYDMVLYNGLELNINNCTVNTLVMIQSSQSRLRDNNMNSIGVYGDYTGAYIHDLDESNYIKDKPIYYTINEHDIVIDKQSYGFIWLVYPYNVTIKDTSINGIVLANANDCKLCNVSSYGSEFGIVLFNCISTTIKDSTFHDNLQHGIMISSSSSTPLPMGNRFIRCISYNNNGHGIYGDMLSECSFYDCIIHNNQYGLYLYGSSYCTIDRCRVSSNMVHGIYISRSSYDTIKNSLLYNNKYGVCISSDNCNIVNCEAYNNELYGIYLIDGSYNTIEYCYSHDNLQGGIQLLFNSVGNTIRYNMIKENRGYGLFIKQNPGGNIVYNNNIIRNHLAGVYTLYATGDRIYSNNLLGNTVNALTYSSNTVWYYNNKGNYYGDYTGVDSDGDGIGDTPYYINNGGIDRRPLISPWSRYRVIDLGVLPGSEESIPYDINNQGVIAGVSGSINGLYNAVVWRDNIPTSLPRLPDSLWGEARAVNDNGIVAGCYDAHACLWVDNDIIPLGSLGDGNHVSYSYDINNNGLVVGVSYLDSYQHQPPHAFLYDYYNDTMVDIHMYPGYISTYAYSINNHGFIAGYSTINHTDRVINYPIVWTPYMDMIQLPLTERGVDGKAFSINDQGVIAGYITRYDHGYEGIIWRDDIPVVLPSLGGFKTIALDVNNHDRIVGASSRLTMDGMIAVLWEGDVIVDLNHVISPNVNWRLIEARAINDQGLITGIGCRDNSTHAFLLIPII